MGWGVLNAKAVAITKDETGMDVPFVAVQDHENNKLEKIFNEIIFNENDLRLSCDSIEAETMARSANLVTGRSRNEQREETRRRLVTAGAEVFARSGVGGARIADIAREAGVAMGTLYTHFPDKEALFAEVMRAGKDVVVEGLRASRDVEGGREAIDRAAMDGVVAFAEIYGALFRLLLSRGGGGDPLQREVVDAIVALRVEELEQGLVDGWVRPDADPESCARCEVGAVFHLLDWWLDDPSKLDRSTLIDRLCAFRRFGAEGRLP